jgi:hypothetical protein
MEHPFPRRIEELTPHPGLLLVEFAIATTMSKVALQEARQEENGMENSPPP